MTRALIDLATLAALAAWVAGFTLAMVAVADRKGSS